MRDGGAYTFKESILDFLLSKQQKQLVSVFRKFGISTFTPDAVSRWCKDQGLPDEVARGFVDLYYGFPSEDEGGLSVEDTLSQVLVIEELTRCAGATLPFQDDLFKLRLIKSLADAGDVSWVEDYYRDCGRLPFAFSLSEPGSGSDTRTMRTSVKSVDGSIVLNGRKSYVNCGEYAPYILVAAIDMDDPDPDPLGALSFWLVPRTLPGIKAVPISKIGQSMLPFASLSFDNVELTPDMRLSADAGSFRHLFQLFEYGRVILCASSVGMAQAAMEDAVAHARSHKAFGVQVGRFQQIEQMLTDMEVKIQNMRLQLYRAAWEVDNGTEERRLDVALLKRYVPKAALEVASDAMQILGGLGYTEAARVSRIWQDCRGNQIAEGTDQIMVRVASPLIMERYRGF